MTEPAAPAPVQLALELPEPGAVSASGRLRARAKARLRTSFPLQSALLLAAVMALNWLPVLFGQVPLAIDIVLHSPIYDTVRSSVEVNRNHAELGDLVAGFYPVHDFARSALAGGDIPLWNRHLLLGQPFLASYQPAVLYPVHLLYGLLPSWLVWSFAFPLRHFIAAWGMALLARAWGCSRSGAIVAGLAFTFSGFMLTWSGWPHVDTAIWLPWCLLAVRALTSSPRPAYVAALAGALAMLLYGGHPQTALYCLAVVVAYALVRVAKQRGEGRVPALVVLSLAGLLGIGLAGAQLLPTAEWLGQTARTLGESRGGHLPPQHWLAWLSRDTRGTPNSAGLLIPEGASYAGVVTLVLAVLAVLSHRRRAVLALAALAVGCAGVAYGWPVLHPFVTSLPVLRGLPSWRLLLLADFAVAMLAGFGLTAVQRLRYRGSHLAMTVWLALTGLTVAIGLLGVQALRTATVRAPDPFLRALRAPVSTGLLLLAAGLLLAPLLWQRLRPRVAAGAVVALLAVDLVSYGYGHIPYIAREDLYPDVPVLERLAAGGEQPYRIASIDSVYAKNLELAYGLDAAGGTGYQIKGIGSLLAPYASGRSGFEFRSTQLAASLDRRLDLMNVRYLVASDFNGGTKPLDARPERFRLVFRENATKVYENRTVLPRAFAVPLAGVREVDTQAEADAGVARKGFDPAREVVVQGEVDTSSVGSAPARVTDVDYAVNDIAVDVVGGHGVLVLSDAHYPGWRVEVDGKRRDLLRVDSALKGVQLRPGDREVLFRYEPGSFARGKALTLLSLLACAGLIVVDRRRRAA